jgi:hypothetical protein
VDVLSFVWAKSDGEVISKKPVTISQKTNRPKKAGKDACFPRNN